MHSRFYKYLAFCRKGGLDTAILGVSLVASAYLLAFVAIGGGRAWVSWYALLPLFVAIRLWRPAGSLLAGAVWGGTLYFFAASSPFIGVSPGLGSFLLLAAVPALYGFAGAMLTRWIGFSPFVLGVGWVGVEFALAPLGLSTGLLGASESETNTLHWLANVLGYVHVALLAALVNAWLVTLLACVPVRVTRPRPAFGRRHFRRVVFPQDVSIPSLLVGAATGPRGPPI
ncbi:MAG: hypothetical protein PVI86_09135 [Phycisphaerae bacterium]|jgi:hypothetical protein